MANHEMYFLTAEGKMCINNGAVPKSIDSCHSCLYRRLFDAIHTVK